MATVEVTVNGQKYTENVESRTLLVHFIRNVLRLIGTHVGCVVGRCGACTILYNGKVAKSCMLYAVQADGADILTVEGVAADPRLRFLQEAFLDQDAAECGYCTPGMLMAASGLLKRQDEATTDEIKEAISGNICRCTGYVNIVAAVAQAFESTAECGGQSMQEGSV